MQTTLQIAFVVLSFVLIGSFVGAFIANLLLGVQSNRDGVKQKSRNVTFWNFGNPLTPMEHYHESARTVWRTRDRCLKIFAIAAGLAVVLAVVAAIADVKLS